MSEPSAAAQRGGAPDHVGGGAPDHVGGGAPDHVGGGAPDHVRERLALVLDVDDLDVAAGMVVDLVPWFGVVKIGLELYAAAGPESVDRLRSMGVDVFLDVKLHDIPTQVGRAARVLGALGVSWLTLHTSGGVDMLRAGVEGLAEGADAANRAAPCALGVTVLTSDADAPESLLVERAGRAAAAGCGGLVCAAGDLAVVRGAAPGLRAVVPGIRLPGSDANDQARPATPGSAIEAGADLLVIGRTVTHAEEPVEAAVAVATQVARALEP